MDQWINGSITSDKNAWTGLFKEEKIQTTRTVGIPSRISLMTIQNESSYKKVILILTLIYTLLYNIHRLHVGSSSQYV